MDEAGAERATSYPRRDRPCPWFPHLRFATLSTMSRNEIELRIRPAEKEDARFLAELWAYGFPGGAGADARLGALLGEGGPYGGLETCWIGEVGGRSVGGFRNLSLRMWLRGRAYPVQGLAAVAVASEARRMGIGRKMCRRALEVGVESGALLSVLFPFRADYYAELGYVLIGELERHDFPPEALPLFPEYRGVRRLSSEEGVELLPRFYADLLPRMHGPVERTPAVWTHLLSGVDQLCGVPGPNGGLRGYMTTEATHVATPERSTLRIRELLAEDAEAYRALLGWISAQRGQWARVQYDASRGERVHKLLTHPRVPGSPAARGLWFPSSVLLRGPMLRILNLPELLREAGAESGAVLPVRDEQLPQNAGVWAWGSDGVRQTGQGVPEQGFPIGLVTELFVEGTLPGQGGGGEGWDPALGIEDFRLLDVF